MDVSEKSGTPKSSILIGFSNVNHPVWGIPILGNTHINDRILTPLESKGQEHFRGDWSTGWGGARQPRPGAKVTRNWALNKGPSPRNPKNPWTLQWKGEWTPYDVLGVFLGPQNSHWLEGSGFLGLFVCVNKTYEVILLLLLPPRYFWGL